MALTIEPKPTENPLRILILEKAIEDLDLITKTLNRMDYPVRIEAVQNRSDFISTLLEFVPQVILANLDIENFSGEEALIFVRRTFPAIPFIILGRNITQQEQLDLHALEVSKTLEKSLIHLLPTYIEQSRIIHASCEIQLMSMNIMSQIKRNIEVLQNMQSNLNGPSQSGNQGYSEYISSKIDQSIHSLRKLGNHLRRKAG